MRTTHGLKALGLCLLGALSLLAVTAAGAQAKGDWRIAGSNTTATKQVSGVVDPGKDFTLKSEIGSPAKPIKILCKTLQTDDGLLFAGETGTALAELLFTECETIINSVVQGACKPDEPILAKISATLIKHTTDSKTYILFSPDGGTNFTEIRLGALPKSECAFGPVVPVSGNLVAACLHGSPAVTGCENEETTHLIEEAAAGLFSDALSFGTHAATLEGSAVLSLPESPTSNWSGLAL